MAGKFLVALLLLALAWMTLKFLREREARLRERGRRAEERNRPESPQRQDEETITLKKDPETGVYRPPDD